MFRKNKDIKETTIDTMRQEAMDAEDYSTVRMLNDIESEMEKELLKERLKGMFGGYGSAMAGFTIGAVIVGRLKSREKS